MTTSDWRGQRDRTLNPWSRIQDEVEKHHEAQLNVLINEYEENGDLDNVARAKAEDALLPVYRKDNLFLD